MLIIYIVGIDPGGTTGVAVFDITEGEFKTLLQIPYDDIMRYGLMSVNDFIMSGSVERVIMERFSLYPKQAKALSWNTLPAVKVIGVVENLCSMLHIPLVTQPASVRKAIPGKAIRETKLNKLGRGLPHARDAGRHVLWFLLRDSTWKTRLLQQSCGGE